MLGPFSIQNENLFVVIVCLTKSVYVVLVKSLCLAREWCVFIDSSFSGLFSGIFIVIVVVHVSMNSSAIGRIHLNLLVH